MQFRHLHASDLEGSTDLPGLREWIAGLTPRHAALLLLAPPGTGKTVAVGAIARHLGREVVLCNLLEVLDAPDNAHQLENLLIACETHPHHLVFLDKLDGFLEAWDRQHPDAPGRAAAVIGEWLRKRKDNLLAGAISVIFVGRDASAVPDTIVSACDQTFIA